MQLNLIDGVIPEPLGGAQREPGAAIQAVGAALGESLQELAGMDGEALKRHRRDKFAALGTAGLV